MILDITGTIAAMNNNVGIVGVTPGTVQLYIVRVFGRVLSYTSDMIDAANRCASAGANIISMSLGSNSSSTTEQAKFDELNAQGILSIAAAGNAGDTSFSYPASYSSVISVAAIDSSKVVASFSQRNNQVDIAAPGVGILSTAIPGGYVSKQGTSMACPHVSAVAALIWSAKPSATNEQVRTALINTAEDLGVVGRDDLYGYGLVRAKQALDYLITSSSSPTSTPAPTTIGLSRTVYTSGTQTSSYYPPGADVIIYTNCFTAVAAGEEQLLLKEAVVGIIRVASAGALVDVGINIYAAEMTSSYGRGTNHLVYSSSSLGSGTATSLQLVSTGDVTNQNIFLKLELASNPGWGGFLIGVEFTGVNAASTSNGWRVVNAPTTGLSIDKFGSYTSSSGFSFGYQFTNSTGGADPSRFLVNVDGSLTSTTTTTITTSPTTTSPSASPSKSPVTSTPTTTSPTTTTKSPTKSPSYTPTSSGYTPSTQWFMDWTRNGGM